MDTESESEWLKYCISYYTNSSKCPRLNLNVVNFEVNYNYS